MIVAIKQLLHVQLQNYTFLLCIIAKAIFKCENAYFKQAIIIVKGQ